MQDAAILTKKAEARLIPPLQCQTLPEKERVLQTLQTMALEPPLLVLLPAEQQLAITMEIQVPTAVMVPEQVLQVVHQRLIQIKTKKAEKAAGRRWGA